MDIQKVEGCRRLKTGNMGFRAHNEECRQRIEAALHSEDSSRWKRAKDKKEEMFWEKIREEENKMKENEKRKAEHEEEMSSKKKKKKRE